LVGVTVAANRGDVGGPAADPVIGRWKLKVTQLNAYA